MLIVMFLSACAVLQRGPDSPPSAAPAKNVAAAANLMPGPQASGTTPEVQARAKDTLVVSGTGNFVKPTPPQPSVPSGPEEFSLNFEATDIRAIVQSIMGDYLRESFTIHPATTGTGTIRLSKPVSRKDLIPILEMMLRQNGQIMLREEGLYKIMPAAQGTPGLGDASGRHQRYTPAARFFGANCATQICWRGGHAAHSWAVRH